ncbi:MAG: hypothetical protein JWR59_2463 [Brevundimonas sp.]|nr:hypothetical protein [Brevundimonas sp.]
MGPEGGAPSLNSKNVASFSSGWAKPPPKNSDSIRLDPNWVTGVVDAEGSFIVFIKMNSQSNKHLIRQVQASFEIGFHIRDLDLLYKIQSFFGGVGNITLPSTTKGAILKITRLDDLVNIIIPHFKQYPGFAPGGKENRLQSLGTMYRINTK